MSGTEGNGDSIGDVLKGAEEMAEGYFPGLSDRIKALDQEQIGRAITLAARNPVNNEVKETLVGYAMSVDQEGTKHVAMFNSGDIFVFENRYDTDSYKEGYKNRWNPSDVPVRLWRSDLAEVLHNFSSSGPDFSTEKIIARNNSEQQSSSVTEALDGAFTVARELKVKRDRVKSETASALMTRIDAFLKPPKPQSPDNSSTQPPPSVPPSAPPTQM